MNFIIPPNAFSEAVRHFWASRGSQARRQGRRGGKDMGGRSAVTGGHQMDGFAETIADLLVNIGGIPEGSIYFHQEMELPGFFRPTKEWDLLVVLNGVLVAAIELKSQVGPSFGNNFNNRVEEGLGVAVDLWTAYREKGFGTAPAPFVGYLFLLEECVKSRSVVQTKEPHFPIFHYFRSSSYAMRYKLYCQRLVLEKHYSAACLLMSSPAQACEERNCTEPAEDLTGEVFLRALLGRAISEKKR